MFAVDASRLSVYWVVQRRAAFWYPERGDHGAESKSFGSLSESGRKFLKLRFRIFNRQYRVRTSVPPARPWVIYATTRRPFILVSIYFPRSQSTIILSISVSQYRRTPRTNESRCSAADYGRTVAREQDIGGENDTEVIRSILGQGEIANRVTRVASPKWATLRRHPSGQLQLDLPAVPLERSPP